MSRTGIMFADTQVGAYWFQYVFLSVTCLLFAAFVYRWKSHPLAKYPGPILAKLTDFYITYHISRGNLHVQERLLHKQYGPVVRIGPNKLIFNTPKALNAIYLSRNVRKSAGYAATDPIPGHPNIFTAIDKGVHRLKRKALSPGFSEQFVRKFEHVVLQSTNEFIEALLPTSNDISHNGWSVPHNMSDRIRYFTVDIMGVFGFGRSFNLQTEDTNRGILLGLKTGTMISGLYAQHPELRRFNVHKFLRAKGSWSQERHGAFVRDMIQKRAELARDAQPDLVSFVIETKDEGTGEVFRPDDLWAESRFFLLAGSESSTTTLSGVFFYLSRYPDCHKKLHDELSRKFSSSDEICLGPALSSCVYLRAVIDESMRLNTPVSNALWREVGQGGLVVDENYVPAGANVGVPLYSLFKSAAIYPEPYTFIPERFLENGRFTERLQEARAAFKPFSLGSRNCAGMNLAYAEMTFLVAKAIWNLEFRIPDGPDGHLGEGSPTADHPGRRHVNEYQIKAFIGALHEGPMLQFRARTQSRERRSV